ncbi:hypothetical protein DPMN_098193 [Dreissena polymorpha]|uniref:Uncharacterized protein n=1 Tax=Dreissena polymorpha TaxID=45954 RepID=A0A9D4LBV4_DREPO|nr:hypothetical protein DPMN_098193 [Dreissena polymorpha]
MLDAQAIETQEKELSIMALLKVPDTEKISKAEKRPTFRVNGMVVCRQTFLLLYCLSVDKLKALQNMFVKRVLFRESTAILEENPLMPFHMPMFCASFDLYRIRLMKGVFLSLLLREALTIFLLFTCLRKQPNWPCTKNTLQHAQINRCVLFD